MHNLRALSTGPNFSRSLGYLMNGCGRSAFPASRVLESSIRWYIKVTTHTVLHDSRLCYRRLQAIVCYWCTEYRPVQVRKEAQLSQRRSDACQLISCQLLHSCTESNAVSEWPRRSLMVIGIGAIHNFLSVFEKTCAKTQKTYKNSSGDEIANVNFLTTISHTRRPTSKYRKRDKPTSFNKLDDR